MKKSTCLVSIGEIENILFEQQIIASDAFIELLAVRLSAVIPAVVLEQASQLNNVLQESEKVKCLN